MLPQKVQKADIDGNSLKRGQAVSLMVVCMEQGPCRLLADPGPRRGKMAKVADFEAGLAPREIAVYLRWTQLQLSLNRKG